MKRIGQGLAAGSAPVFLWALLLGPAGFLPVHAEDAVKSAPGVSPDQVRKTKRPPNPKVTEKASEKKQLLFISIRGLVEEHENSPTFFSNSRPVDILSIFRAFQMARRDDRVKGILMRLEPSTAGWAKCEELRTLIKEFRTSGKKVTVWMPYGTDRELFVASAADEILMPPAGMLLLMGLRAEVTFFKGLFDKIGIEPEIVHIGAYKAAGEPYSRTEMSPEFRETIEALLDDTFEAFVGGTAQGRGLSEARLRELISNGPYRSSEALKSGLIDKEIYLDEYLEKLREKEHLKIVSQRKYLGAGFDEPDFGSLGGLLSFLSQMTALPETSSSGSDKIALVYAVGPILADGPSGGFPGRQNVITAGPLVKALKEVRNDKTVKAVILRVDSPGGDVVTSDIIWRAVQRTNEVKPVIVSMSDVAASGGYYISMPATEILAYPTTITGSIGVLGGKFNLLKLYQLVGLNVDVVERGAGSGLFSMNHKLTEEERSRLRKMLKQTYDLFLEKAAAGRNQKVDQLAKAAQGRAWSAKRAKDLGLIDGFGGLRAAINLAKKHIGKKPDELMELKVLPRRKSLFELFGGTLEDARSPLPAGLRAFFPDASLWKQLALARILGKRMMLLTMPATVEIK